MENFIWTDELVEQYETFKQTYDGKADDCMLSFKKINDKSNKAEVVSMLFKNEKETKVAVLVGENLFRISGSTQELYTLKELKEKGFDIFKIKRLSDNVLFTITKDREISLKNCIKINDCFYVICEFIQSEFSKVLIREVQEYFYKTFMGSVNYFANPIEVNVSSLTCHKNVILKSFDENYLLDGDVYYELDKETYQVNKKIAESGVTINQKDKLIFCSLEKATNYYYSTKSCLSINEITSVSPDLIQYRQKFIKIIQNKESTLNTKPNSDK